MNTLGDELDQLADQVEALYGEDSDQLAEVNYEQQMAADVKSSAIKIAKKLIALKEANHEK